MYMSLYQTLQSEEARIFNIRRFPTYEVTIDFSNEKSKMDGLAKMEALTLDVQKECPVAKQLGAKGKEVKGEGIVWQVVKISNSTKLNLEKFKLPSCWMKTREVDQARSALSSMFPMKQQESDQDIKDMQQVANSTILPKQQRIPIRPRTKRTRLPRLFPH